MAQRVTRSEADIAAMRGRSLRRGILPFLKDGSEVAPELTERYRRPVSQDHRTPAPDGEKAAPPSPRSRS